MVTITINNTDRQYLYVICSRDGYDILSAKDEGGKTEYQIHCSPGMEEEILEDIACEKQREESQDKFPVFSLRTIRNREKFGRLGGAGSCFHILQQDKEKAAQYYGYPNNKEMVKNGKNNDEEIEFEEIDF